MHQAPTEARTSPRPGMLADDDALGGEPLDGRSRLSVAPGDERRAPAAEHVEAALREAVREPVRQIGGPTVDVRPAQPAEQVDRREPPRPQRPHPRAAVEPPRVGVERQLRRALRIRERLEAGERRRQCRDALRPHEEAARAARAAEPLLTGGRVEVAAEGADVRRHGAEPLRAVEQQRGACRGEGRRVRDLPADPGHVRARDEPGARARPRPVARRRARFAPRLRCGGRSRPAARACRGAPRRS